MCLDTFKCLDIGTDKELDLTNTRVLQVKQRVNEVESKRKEQ